MGKARKPIRGVKSEASESAEAATGAARGGRGARTGAGVRGSSKEREDEITESVGEAGAGANQAERPVGRERRASEESDMPETKRFRKCESSANNSDMAAGAAARETEKSVHALTATAESTAAVAVSGPGAGGGGSESPEAKGESSQAQHALGRAGASAGTFGDDKNSAGEFGTPQNDIITRCKKGRDENISAQGLRPPPKCFHTHRVGCHVPLARA
jgi:hypothetical protein